MEPGPLPFQKAQKSDTHPAGGSAHQNPRSPNAGLTCFAVCFAVCLNFCLTVCLTARLNICLTVCLTVCLNVSDPEIQQ